MAPATFALTHCTRGRHPVAAGEPACSHLSEPAAELPARSRRTSFLPELQQRGAITPGSSLSDADGLRESGDAPTRPQALSSVLRHRRPERLFPGQSGRHPVPDGPLCFGFLCTSRRAAGSASRWSRPSRPPASATPDPYDLSDDQPATDVSGKWRPPLVPSRPARPVPAQGVGLGCESYKSIAASQAKTHGLCMPTRTSPSFRRDHVRGESSEDPTMCLSRGPNG